MGGIIGSRTALFRFLSLWRHAKYYHEDTSSECRKESLDRSPVPLSFEPLTDPATGNVISPQIAAALYMKPTANLTPLQRVKVEAIKAEVPEFRGMRAVAG